MDYSVRRLQAGYRRTGRLQDGEADYKTGRQTTRRGGRQAVGAAGRKTIGRTDRQTGQADEQTDRLDRQTNGQAEERTGRGTDRQTDYRMDGQTDYGGQIDWDGLSNYTVYTELSQPDHGLIYSFRLRKFSGTVPKTLFIPVHSHPGR